MKVNSKTMIAKKDLGDTIKKGDEVDVLYFMDVYSFSEFKEGWRTWDKEESKYIFDNSKHLVHKIDVEELCDCFRDLTDEEKLVGHCTHCEREIVRDEEFLLYADDEDDENIYCSDCVEDYTVTNFMVGGEFLGTDDDGWSFETR